MEEKFAMTKEEFKSLPLRNKLDSIYENIIFIREQTKELKDEFDKHAQNDKFNFKVLYIIITTLSIVFGLTKYLGVI